jgi:Zn-dependent protease
MDPQKIMYLILLAPGMILAISLHEAMHGYVANRLGDPTAKFLGRLTLNPFKHIDPIGTILVPAVLFMTSGMMFGWAKPVPVAVQNLKNPKRDMAIVAAGGPGANLILAIIASAALYLIAGVASRVPLADAVRQTVVVPLVMIFFYMLQFNLFLMMFNLLPIPPLDGGRILVGLLPLTQARVVEAIEPYGFWVLILLLMADRYVHFLRTFMAPVYWLQHYLVPSAILQQLIGG